MNELFGSLGDAHISSLGWSENGEDFWIRFVCSDGADVTILFACCTRLKLEMDFGEYSGMPLVYGVARQPQNDVGLEVTVTLGAAPEGWIHLCCNDLRMISS